MQITLNYCLVSAICFTTMAYLKNKLYTRCSESSMYKTTTTLWQPTASRFFKLTILTSALTALGLTGCTSTPSKPKSGTSQVSGSGYLDASSLDSLEDLLSATDMRAVEGDRLLILKHGDVWKRMTVGFKMDLNKWDSRIEAQRGWFISRQPYLDRLSARASRYLYHTVKEAERRGIPTELALLPIIESSYDPAATSSAAAAGMWQFIPSTGKIYGLKQSGSYDGRRDVVESTRAAYEFLGSLYNQFGSWELALAAYNAGPGRIQQAINRNQAAGLPTDYWSLRLPQETMNYVPRFLAVAQIIKNPQAYSVSLPPIANRPHFREVAVPANSSLNEIAVMAGLSRAELYALNPGYRGEFIDYDSPMRILIPADVSPTVDTKLRGLKAGSTSGMWASTTTPPLMAEKTTPPVLVTTTPKVSTTTTTGSVVTPTITTPVVKTPSVSGEMKVNTPSGSNALASFASNADIPSAPRIPVAVTPAVNVRQVNVEPPISAKEREELVALVREEGHSKTVEEVLKPQATQAEKQQVVEEIKAIAPQGTEIVDPLDGKIKLTAIQTSQSVAEQKGQEVTKGFAYPQAVTDNTPANSDEAQRNKGKDYVKTGSELVVSPPKGKRSTYTVLAGDTLALIAMKNGVNWRDVANWNQIDPNATLYVGTTIYLYDAKPQEVKEADSSKVNTNKVPEVYVVQAGESLTGLANQFGLSLKQLADYNGLQTDSNLLVGQKLSTRMKTKVYTVQRGEYLKLIADRYGLSNQELADLNDHLNSGSNLLVGQKIKVPLQEVESASNSSSNNNASSSNNSSNNNTVSNVKYEGVKVQPSYKTESYKVRSGDTLSSIATQARLSLSELADLNNIASNSGVRVGQNLKVPIGTKVPEQYVVQSGDTLSGISDRYNLQPDYVANLNGLTRTSGVRVGQRLKLTGDIAEKTEATKTVKDQEISTAETPESHVVKSGETLASIAKKYFLQVDYLAGLNNLTRNAKVRTGQRLKLTGEVEKTASKVADAIEKKNTSTSASSGKATEKYTVKSGESLNVIASRLDISVSELASLNNLPARSGLRVGQNIVVPKLTIDYKVKRGDTLIGLASRYGIAADALATLNDLKPSTQLRIGDVIKVPNI